MFFDTRNVVGQDVFSEELALLGFAAGVSDGPGGPAHGRRRRRGGGLGVAAGLHVDAGIAVKDLSTAGIYGCTICSNYYGFDCYNKAIELEPLFVKAWYNKKMASELQLKKSGAKVRYQVPRVSHNRKG